MTDEAPGFEGLFYDDANKAVTEALEKVGALQNYLSLLTLIHMIGVRKSQLFSVQQHNGLLPLKHSVRNYLKQLKKQN